MIITTFETNNNIVADYNPVTDTLQFPEELINTFDYEGTSSISPIFKEFLAIAEEIDSGNTIDLKYSKLDEGMGQIGLGQTVIPASRPIIEGL